MTLRAVGAGPSSGESFSDPTITGGSINGTHIGNVTPSDGAFTTLDATSADILGPLQAEHLAAVSSSQSTPLPLGSSVQAFSSGNITAVTFSNALNVANNRIVYMRLDNNYTWSTGLANDAFNTLVPALAIQYSAGDVNKIDSSSGAGQWTHSGPFQVNGTVVANTFNGNGIVQTGSASGGVPSISTMGVNPNVSLEITTKGTGGITISRPTIVSGTLGATGAIDAGGGLRVKEGANAKQGVATLVAGVVTVANTSVTANSRIFVQRQTDGGTVAASYSITRTAGASFTITAKDGAGANNTTDTSVVAYQIFEPGA